MSNTTNQPSNGRNTRRWFQGIGSWLNKAILRREAKELERIAQRLKNFREPEAAALLEQAAKILKDQAS